MRSRDIIIIAALIVALSGCAGAISMPSLLGQPIVPQIVSMPSLQSTQALTPDQVAAQSADSTFTLSVSGNVYYDKLPVQGAVVSLYLNGQFVGRQTAGDIYSFQVPGVRKGDTVRVDANYQGTTGSATKTVQFQSMYLDVDVSSGHSFIRDALSMLPTSDDLSQAQSQPASTADTSSSSSTPSTSGTGSSTSSSSDTSTLVPQVFSDTSKMLSSGMGQSGGAASVPADDSTSIPGNNYQVSSLGDALDAAGLSGLPV